MLYEKVFFNEKDGTQMIGGGRKLTWIMKSANDDSRYTSVCIVEIEPSLRVKPAHSHPGAEEVVYIVSGTGKALIGEQINPIQPGSLVYFPEGVPHMLWNNGKELLKGICFYASTGKEIIYEYHDDIDFPEYRRVCSNFASLLQSSWSYRQQL
ncbi:MAG: cupin domain-containing protein [Acetivibrionales bacterium]